VVWGWPATSCSYMAGKWCVCIGPIESTSGAMYQFCSQALLVGLLGPCQQPVVTVLLSKTADGWDCSSCTHLGSLPSAVYSLEQDVSGGTCWLCLLLPVLQRMYHVGTPVSPAGLEPRHCDVYDCCAVLCCAALGEFPESASVLTAVSPVQSVCSIFHALHLLL
jgi:hypothetical protein